MDGHRLRKEDALRAGTVYHNGRCGMDWRGEVVDGVTFLLNRFIRYGSRDKCCKELS